MNLEKCAIVVIANCGDPEALAFKQGEISSVYELYERIENHFPIDECTDLLALAADGNEINNISRDIAHVYVGRNIEWLAELKEEHGWPSVEEALPDWMKLDSYTEKAIENMIRQWNEDWEHEKPTLGRPWF